MPTNNFRFFKQAIKENDMRVLASNLYCPKWTRAVCLVTVSANLALGWLAPIGSLPKYGRRRTTINPNQMPTTHSFTSIAMAKDWDAIIAEEEESSKENVMDEGVQSKIPPDMMYNPRNCNRCSKNFKALKDAGAPGADLYGVAPKKFVDEVQQDNEEATFWFIGKVAHISDVTLEQAVARQWCLIQQHSANLRPFELFGCASNLEMEIWTAPLDTEMDVAYNRPDVAFRKMEPDVEGASDVDKSFIGFQGEVYEASEEGFRVWRHESTGLPTRPEIKGPSDPASAGSDENRAPTDDELEQFAKVMEGKDINEIYEEQERRRAAGEL